MIIFTAHLFLAQSFLTQKKSISGVKKKILRGLKNPDTKL
jgi:hypothetical protein